MHIYVMLAPLKARPVPCYPLTQRQNTFGSQERNIFYFYFYFASIASCSVLLLSARVAYVQLPLYSNEPFYVFKRACSGHHIWSEVVTREAQCHVLANGIFSTECGRPVIPEVQHSYRQTQALLEQLNSYYILTKYILKVGCNLTFPSTFPERTELPSSGLLRNK